MPRPTLLQSLLNRPSQSYASSSSPSSRPPPRYFHSMRDEMLRLAGDGNNFTPPQHDRPSMPSYPDSDTTLDHKQRRRPPEQPPTPAVEDEEEDEFYTPDTSPRVSAFGEQPSPHVISPTSQEYPPVYLSLPSPTPSSSSLSLPSSSSASCSDYSWQHPHSSPSTRATSPVQSDAGKRSFSDEASDVTPARSSSRSSSRRRKRNREYPLTEDWAKDVRWLVSPSGYSKPSPSASVSRRRSSSSKGPASDSPMLQTLAPSAIPDRTMPAIHRRTKSIGSAASPRRVIARRRMSAVWEEDESGNMFDSVQTAASVISQSRSAKQDRNVSSTLSPLTRASTISALPNTRARAQSQSSSVHHHRTPSVLSNYTSASRTVELPMPLPVSDGGVPEGLSSLVMPRAAYTPKSGKRYSALFGSDEPSDKTRADLPQSTMSTIAITKNAAGGGPYGSRPRLLSLSNLSLSSSLEKRKEKRSSLNSNTSPNLVSDLPPPLALTSHTSPSKVGSQQVLVKVFAVGLDHLDDLIVDEKVTKKDCYGFVPGRSFIGRVVECGYEVNTVSKSDWVTGLLDVRKCGALAEYLVVEKRRLTRCPRPSPSLTIDHLALLPLCGIPSHRAVRAFDHIERGSKALVLEGHDGAGALAAQELALEGVRVTVQVTPEQIQDKDKSAEWVRLIHERVREWGVQEILVDSPLDAIASLRESGFDFVLDTIGGRKIREACRRVLHTTGQFTTLVGESDQAVPSINAHFKSNLRSMRRGFSKKDHKAIGYSWISPVLDVDADGEDVRDSLEAVVQLAEKNILKPWVESSRTVLFERAPRLFEKGDRNALGQGRTAVIRIID